VNDTIPNPNLKTNSRTCHISHKSMSTTPPRARRNLIDCLEQHNPECIQELPIHRPEPLYWRSAVCTTMRHVLSESECQSIIEGSEQTGFEPALLNVGGGRQEFIPGVRSSDRLIIDDKEFARAIFHRIRHLVPKEYRDSNGRRLKATCLNERMRILRYQPGHYFHKHMDGQYERPDGSEESRMTVMIYLNNNFQGGHTRIYADKGEEYATVPTEAGLVFVFDHRLPHESPVLERGTKYAIRTDVMFAEM